MKSNFSCCYTTVGNILKNNISKILWNYAKFVYGFLCVMTAVNIGLAFVNQYISVGYAVIFAVFGSFFALPIYYLVKAVSKYNSQRKYYQDFFSFKKFKADYAIAPEQYVFSDESYYLNRLDSENIADKGQYRSACYGNWVDTTEMYPITFMDAVKTYFFGQYVYATVKNS